MRLVVAVLLLTAAGLKGHALLLHPLSPGSPLLSRPMEYLAVGVEVALGLWLLSGWQAPLAWLTALVTFTAFAGASAWLALQGHSSCGCFGAVPVSPWLALGLDVTALSLLLVCWPSRSAWREDVNWGRWRQVGIIGTVFSLMAASAWWGLPVLGVDVASWLARWRADRVTMSPALVEVGEGPPGPGQTFVVTLHNHGATTLSVLGGTSDCGCLATSDLPVSIPPGEQRDIRIMFKRSGPPGLFKRGYWLYTDDPRQPFVVAWFAGRTVAPAAAATSSPVAVPTTERHLNR